MKRFITYLYEYDSGYKSKNTGFIRVDIRGDNVRIEIRIQNGIRGNQVGQIYALVKTSDIEGIPLGDIEIIEGRGRAEFVYGTKNIADSGFSLNDVIGVGILFADGVYFASCWREEQEDEVGRADSYIQKKEKALSIERIEPEMVQEERTREGMEQMQEIACETNTVYQKMELDKLRTLPSPNWHLANNSFLLHGFWNYGYLVLKKEMEEDKENYYLGVPGIFEMPEMVMAVVFGFTQFEEIPEEMIEEELYRERHFPKIEKNQEPKNGVFGCWFVALQE